MLINTPIRIGAKKQTTIYASFWAELGHFMIEVYHVLLLTNMIMGVLGEVYSIRAKNIINWG